MYGAVLRRRTELVDSGEAHMGVLFLTNDGYSTMCGHATLAVARLLVDHVGTASKLFVMRAHRSLDFDPSRQEVDVRLHVPCGLVRVTVPAIGTGPGRWKTDTARPISYLSVPGFATAIGVTLSIPAALRWPELGERNEVVVDVAYGGAFYIICPASALGFPMSLAKPSLRALSEATSKLKAAFNSFEQLRKSYLQHPDHPDLQFLYGTIVTDRSLGSRASDTLGAETGLCYFADEQIDRSPTGSGVQARVAMAMAKGELKLGDRWTYHSLVSNSHDGEGAFVGSAVEEVEVGGRKGVIVQVSGWARYTGCSTFALENEDDIGKGFCFDGLGEDTL